MNPAVRRKYLRIALVVTGLIFMFVVFPMSRLWPAGFLWHQGGTYEYINMITVIYFVLGIFLLFAAWRPERQLGLIGFAIWSSFAHAGIMAWMVFANLPEHWVHLIADVPVLLVVGIVLAWLCPRALLFQFGRGLPATTTRE